MTIIRSISCRKTNLHLQIWEVFSSLSSSLNPKKEQLCVPKNKQMILQTSPLLEWKEGSCNSNIITLHVIVYYQEIMVVVEYQFLAQLSITRYCFIMEYALGIQKSTVHFLKYAQRCGLSLKGGTPCIPFGDEDGVCSQDEDRQCKICWLQCQVYVKISAA